MSKPASKSITKPKIPLFVVLVVVIAIFLFFGRSLFIAKTSQKNISSEVLEEPTDIILEIFSPPVFVLEPGASDFSQGSQGQKIPVSTIVKTSDGGRAQIVFPNGTVTRIGENSEITLSDFSNSPFQTRISVEKGRIWSRIVKLLGGASFETQSGSVVASIRGTSYGHELLANGFDQLIVTKNKMLGECINKTQSNEVQSSQKAIFNCQADSKPIISALTLQDTSDEWFIFNNEQDKILNERFGKDRYDHESQLILATPTPTNTPTPTPTSTPTPTPTAQPSPTPSPTPQPTITITSINFSCDRVCSGVIYGNLFNQDTKVSAVSKSKLSTFPASSYKFISTKEMNASFSQIPKGEYYIQVTNPDKTSATSDQTFVN